MKIKKGAQWTRFCALYFSPFLYQGQNTLLILHWGCTWSLTEISLF